MARNGDTKRYTPTQQRILNLLSDGAERTIAEIRAVVADEYTSDKAIQIHIHYINRALPRHLSVVSRSYSNSVCKYRLMRAILPSDE